MLREIDGLIAHGVEYIYFIDEIFLPQKDLLAALAQRSVKIGVQTRVDLWPEEMIEMLAFNFDGAGAAIARVTYPPELPGGETEERLEFVHPGDLSCILFGDGDSDSCYRLEE